MFFVNIIKSYRDVITICDSELLGKKFEEGRFQLDIKEGFYKGKKETKEGVIKIIRKFSIEDATFNIVGENSIKAALDANIIKKDEIKRIQGIPFALVLV
ncbi:MAG: DUF424 family protein [Candidatus Pacearchaeota archaeon]